MRRPDERTGAVLRFDVAALGKDQWRSPAGRDRPSLVTALSSDGLRIATTDFAFEGEGPDAVRCVIRGTTDGTEQAVKSPGRWMRAAFRPDGGLIVLENDQRIRLIEPNGEPGREVEAFNRDSPGAMPLATSTPDGRTLVGITTRRKPPPTFLPVQAQIKTWDMATLKPGPVIESDLSEAFPSKCDSPTAYPTGYGFDPTGQRLAVAFHVIWQTEQQNRIESRGAVVVWDLTTGKEVFRRIPAEPLRAVGFDPAGRVVAAGGSAGGGVVLGWDIATGAEVLSLRGHTRPILALAFGPDGRLATGSLDRVVKVWDLASKREILTLDGFAREVTHLAFTRDGKNLVVGTGVDLLTAMIAGGLPTDWPPAEVRIFRGPR